MEKESIGSQEFDAAKQLEKLCLRSAWITDSISQGYAMPVENYILDNSKNRAAPTSTKASDDDPTNPDNSKLSDTPRTMSRKSISLKKAAEKSIEHDFKQMLINAKKVGPLLNDFNILLKGFSATDLPFISKVVKTLGATILDSANEQVTHVIVGTLDPKLFVELKDVTAKVLKVMWLKSIVKNKRLVNEAEFEISPPVSLSVILEDET
jgi:hypothetical protein